MRLYVRLERKLPERVRYRKGPVVFSDDLSLATLKQIDITFTFFSALTGAVL